MMTRAEMLALTIERCDARLEAELERTEILLVDLGATAEELENMLSLARKWLCEDRDAQIAAMAAWLSGCVTLH